MHRFRIIQRYQSYFPSPSFQIDFSASLGLDADIVEVQKVARDFARREMYPNMAKWDREVLANSTTPCTGVIAV